MIDVFVNYRTADSAMAAALLDTKLVARFGPGHGLEVRPRHDDVEVLLREIARYVPPREGSAPAPPQSGIRTGNISGSNVTFGSHSPVISIGNTGSERDPS